MDDPHYACSLVFKSCRLFVISSVCLLRDIIRPVPVYCLSSYWLRTSYFANPVAPYINFFNPLAPYIYFFNPVAPYFYFFNLVAPYIYFFNPVVPYIYFFNTVAPYILFR